MPAPHDLDPDAMTDAELRSKRLVDAAIAFEMMPEPRHAPDCKCSGCYIPKV
jgi:hypothetical protein